MTALVLLAIATATSFGVMIVVVALLFRGDQ